MWTAGKPFVGATLVVTGPSVGVEDPVWEQNLDVEVAPVAQQVPVADVQHLVLVEVRELEVGQGVDPVVGVAEVLVPVPVVRAQGQVVQPVPQSRVRPLKVGPHHHLHCHSPTFRRVHHPSLRDLRHPQGVNSNAPGVHQVSHRKVSGGRW